MMPPCWGCWLSTSAEPAYHVITAVSGTTGLQTFYDHHPDLVILDVMMPKMDGWAVCERLRENSDVPIIMLTAKGEEQDRLRGFRLGVDDYVVKPFSFAELVARVGAILDPQPAHPGRILTQPPSCAATSSLIWPSGA